MKWFIVKKYPETPKHAGDYEQVILKVNEDDIPDLKKSKRIVIMFEGDSLGDVICQMSTYINGGISPYDHHVTNTQQ